MWKNEIFQISRYFGVSCGNVTLDEQFRIPCLTVKDGNKVKGIATIAKYIAKNCKQQNGILGASLEDQANVDQWLEFRSSRLDRYGTEKDLSSVLKELNSYLSSRTFLVGSSVTLADLLMFYGLHSVYSDLSYFDKQRYMHLSRWFRMMQLTSGVKQKLETIPFQRNLIYPCHGVAH
ncbi:unnamed protein product [Owenia fusiformis]|uniref:GST C-terminal domain-containing protein n=1 Tax=Owenia fusiformis TaxID=6347 RepID=A0A8S4MZ82_OWEFU|nr:unnamed protein product [Owenia fusiformis]